MAEGKVARIRSGYNLYDYEGRKEGESLLTYLEKTEEQDAGASSQKKTIGKKLHPFRMKAVRDFKTANVHHSACIETKVAATVGLGFKNEKVEDELDELCRVTWNNVIEPVCEDYWSCGNGYLEVVRNTEGNISGLHHVPGHTVFIYFEDAYNKDFHYVVTSQDYAHSNEKKFADFGDLEGFKARNPHSSTIEELKRTSEIIRFPKPSTLSSFYGYPDWLSAVPLIELSQMITQYNFDFFLNRGVPEFLLWITGGTVDEDLWNEIKSSLNATIGLGNSRKTMAINLPFTDMEINVEKLGLDTLSEGSFSEMSDAIAAYIVTAHGVPPALANIQFPGKMGAANELPSGIAAFQAMRIARTQKHFKRILKGTLGRRSGGVSGLSNKKFDFRKITEEINLGETDTLSRMRQSLPEAESQGRDLNAGLKKAESELKEVFIKTIYALPDEHPVRMVFHELEARGIKIAA